MSSKSSMGGAANEIGSGSCCMTGMAGGRAGGSEERENEMRYLYSYSLYDYGLYSYGLYSHGLDGVLQALLVGCIHHQLLVLEITRCIARPRHATDRVKPI